MSNLIVYILTGMRCISFAGIYLSKPSRERYVIDDAKATLETVCPHTISCADIIAIAARDVVAMSGGPYWNVLKGRKDGRVSKANDTINLPAPTFNATQLIQSFAKRGLGIKDMVALSGGRTLGFSHCSSFEARLHNFSSVHDVDPSMNSEFAEKLGNKCPRPNEDHTAGDMTSAAFDNDYYKQLMEGKRVSLDRIKHCLVITEPDGLLKHLHGIKVYSLGNLLLQW